MYFYVNTLLCPSLSYSIERNIKKQHKKKQATSKLSHMSGIHLAGRGFNV